MALQHLRSSTANKRPTPAGMSDGQLALNTNNASPGLFFKDSNGALVKVGPVHVGTTAPNATPGAGGSSGNAIGEQWLDTTGGTYVFKTWDGSAWRSESGTFVDVNGDVMTGALGIIAGSAGSPGLYFSGDTNTGLYSPGADQVAISTNSSQRLLIDASGNVSVGTTTKASNTHFDLYSTSSYAQYIRFRDEAGAPGLIGYSHTDDSLQFYTSGLERLRITSAGLVGVGTSIPSTQLHVAGGRTLCQTGNENYSLGVARSGSTNAYYLGINSNAEPDLLFSNNGGTTRMVLTNGGSLGVGTTGPNFPLEVVGSTANTIVGVTATTGAASFKASNTGQTFYVGVDNSANSFLGGGAYSAHLWASGAYPMVFSTNATERARIDSSGRLGIGTSTVNADLHVYDSAGDAEIRITSNASNQAILRFGNTVDQTLGSIRFDSPTDSLQFYGLNDTERLRIDSSGRLGIGTTSVNSKLAVSNGGAESFEFYPADASNVNKINYYNRSGAVYCDAVQNAASHQFAIQGTEKARLDSSGRLLVGTSSARANFFGAVSARTQVEGGSTEDSTISIVRNSNDNDGPTLLLGRSRGTGNTIVQSGDRIGRISFQANDGSNFLNSTLVEAYVDGTPGTSDMPTRLVFSTTRDSQASPTEALRIDREGSQRSFSVSTGTAFEYSVSSGAGTSTALIGGSYGGTGTTAQGTVAFRVWSNGNVVNTNNSYGSLSDVKLKENIVDASSQWSDIKALQVRNYNFKEGQTHTQIGLVAQEIELVSPGLVTESPDRDAEGNDLGTVTKSVNYSVLYMKAVKALQEAMERIEQLEQRLTDAGIA